MTQIFDRLIEYEMRIQVRIASNHMQRKLINATMDLLQECLNYGPPEIFIGGSESFHYEELVFYRLIELQIKQCAAIKSLCKNNLFRPAYAVLRSVLENMATLVWITLDVKRHVELFDNGNQPNMREILARIGWEEEYSRTFRFLSGFVHVDFNHSDLYKNYELNTKRKVYKDSLWTEVIKDSDESYIVQTPEGFAVYLVKPMTAAEIQSAYGPYLMAKTFDLAIVGLEKIYGTEISNKRWWPNQAVSTFVKMCTDDPEFGQRMLGYQK